jgi:hypothetical protein
VVPVDAVHWIVQRFQVCQLSLNVLEAVLVLNCVNRPCQIFYVLHVCLVPKEPV